MVQAHTHIPPQTHHGLMLMMQIPPRVARRLLFHVLRSSKLGSYFMALCLKTNRFSGFLLGLGGEIYRIYVPDILRDGNGSHNFSSPKERQRACSLDRIAVMKYPSAAAYKIKSDIVISRAKWDGTGWSIGWRLGFAYLHMVQPGGGFLEPVHM